MKRLLALVGVLVISGACGSSPTPTAPSTVTAAPAPTPVAPTVTSVSISGTGCSGVVCSAPGSVQLTATAAFSNGTTQNVTANATWTSSFSSVATVVSGAVIPRGTAAGETDVLATYQGVLGGVTIRVPSPYSATGRGNNVFEVPAYVSRLHIVGTYAGSSSNFVVWIGAPGSACAIAFGSSCRLLVNVIIGTFGLNAPIYDGIVQTGGGTIVSISDSNNVTWAMTEVRP